MSLITSWASKLKKGPIYDIQPSIVVVVVVVVIIIIIIIVVVIVIVVVVIIVVIVIIVVVIVVNVVIVVVMIKIKPQTLDFWFAVLHAWWRQFGSQRDWHQSNKEQARDSPASHDLPPMNCTERRTIIAHHWSSESAIGEDNLSGHIKNQPANRLLAKGGKVFGEPTSAKTKLGERDGAGRPARLPSSELSFFTLVVLLRSPNSFSSSQEGCSQANWKRYDSRVVT